MEQPFVNKVADSGIITLNLEDYYPTTGVEIFDMKDYLFMELILKEKDFREKLKEADFSIYQDKIVAVTCSADAVIPVWAYMLVASVLQPIAKDVVFGTKEDVLNQLVVQNIQNIEIEKFTDQRIVVKGCGELPISESAYLTITHKLRPVAKSIMYGEPCSTVPVFKKSIVRNVV